MSEEEESWENEIILKWIFFWNVKWYQISCKGLSMINVNESLFLSHCWIIKFVKEFIREVINICLLDTFSSLCVFFLSVEIKFRKLWFYLFFVLRYSCFQWQFCRIINFSFIIITSLNFNKPAKGQFYVCYCNQDGILK